MDPLPHTHASLTKFTNYVTLKLSEYQDAKIICDVQESHGAQIAAQIWCGIF